MKRITTGKLANVLKGLNPAINRHMVNRWVKAGDILSDQNPGVENGWYILDQESVKSFILDKFVGTCDAQKVHDCLSTLGLFHKAYPPRNQ